MVLTLYLPLHMALVFVYLPSQIFITIPNLLKHWSLFSDSFSSSEAPAGTTIYTPFTNADTMLKNGITNVLRLLKFDENNSSVGKPAFTSPFDAAIRANPACKISK